MSHHPQTSWFEMLETSANDAKKSFSPSNPHFSPSLPAIPAQFVLVLLGGFWSPKTPTSSRGFVVWQPKGRDPMDSGTQVLKGLGIPLGRIRTAYI